MLTSESYKQLSDRCAQLAIASYQPSFGDEYKSGFAAMFSDLAKEHNLLFYPAFDDAFVDDAQLKLPDGLHPTAAGIEAVVTRILPTVEALIDRARRRDR